MFIHAVVPQRGLPSLEGKKNELFVGKKWKKQLSNSSQTDYMGDTPGEPSPPLDPPINAEISSSCASI